MLYVQALCKPKCMVCRAKGSMLSHVNYGAPRVSGTGYDKTDVGRQESRALVCRAHSFPHGLHDLRANFVQTYDTPVQIY
jgi:hypothetical protein